MNTYLQAAVHNLKTVRAEKAIAERDRDRYFETSAANFEQFRKVEAELVAEQEKVRTLEACLLYTSPSPRDQRGSRMPSSA